MGSEGETRSVVAAREDPEILRGLLRDPSEDPREDRYADNRGLYVQLTDGSWRRRKRK